MWLAEAQASIPVWNFKASACAVGASIENSQ
jgi:hypothetical protein